MWKSGARPAGVPAPTGSQRRSGAPQGRSPGKGLKPSPATPHTPKKPSPRQAPEFPRECPSRADRPATPKLARTPRGSPQPALTRRTDPVAPPAGRARAALLDTRSPCAKLDACARQPGLPAPAPSQRPALRPAPGPRAPPRAPPHPPPTPPQPTLAPPILHGSRAPRPAPPGPAHITHPALAPHPTPASCFQPLVHTPNSRIPHPHPPASPQPSCGSTSRTPHPAPPGRSLRAVGVRV